MRRTHGLGGAGLARARAEPRQVTESGPPFSLAPPQSLCYTGSVSDKPSFPAKTNAMRALDQRRVPYTAHAFPPAIHSADGVADALAVPASTVYKTLVAVRPRGRPLLVMVGGDRELDLRLLARSLGEKSLDMAGHDQAESLTGLQVGGISALALLGKGFDVYIDAPAPALDQVYVSAGQRGLNLHLATADLIRVTGAKVVEATSAPA
jgi:Cys-tRNA(Pro)/Cys-tRNA(Cys) deacylase